MALDMGKFFSRTGNEIEQWLFDCKCKTGHWKCEIEHWKQT